MSLCYIELFDEFNILAFYILFVYHISEPGAQKQS